jgi:hypothetical protein
VHNSVDAAELGFGSVENCGHRVFVADIALHGDGPASGLVDLGESLLGLFGVGGVVEDDGVAVAAEAYGAGSADAARSAGDDGDAAGVRTAVSGGGGVLG